MIILILLTTALTVSLDSFFCGLSLSLKTKGQKSTIWGITASVFAMCILGSALGKTAGSILNEYAQILGGIFLIIIAFIQIIPKNHPKKIQSSFCESIAIGVAIGTDGALGCFTLSLYGINGLYSSLLITLMHIALLYLSFSLTKYNYLKRLLKLQFISPFILLILGLIKLIP